MKIGIEVEGRYKGINTLFIDAVDVTIENVNKAFYIEGKPILAIYISDKTCILDVEKRAIVYNYLCKGYIVSIEAPSFEHIWHDSEVYAKCHLILSLPQPDLFFKLKETDSIKFSKDNSVYMYSKESAYKTIPTDFINDKEI